MKITGIWNRTDKKDNEMLTIKTEDGKLLNAFPNQFKTEDKHPDYVVVDFSQTDEEGFPKKVGAIWKGTTKKGGEKINIKIEDEYFTAVPVKEKKNEKQPDYVIMGE